ncbi:MAG: winged helix-turn-helix domain-containing protein [Oscillospiraceae bacterium]|nr:winged helix-turn-helix domain-containing protein [Oscillospiraceae bacterium]
MFPNLLAEMAANGQITQKALAEELGLTEKTMGAKLTGQTDFKYSEMKKLKRKFKKSMDYLFSETRSAEN